MRVRFLLPVAFATLLTACEVSEPFEPDRPPVPEDLVEVEEPELSSFVFSSDADTKTVHVTGGVEWSAGDQIRMGYTVDGQWQGAAGNASQNYPARLYASDALAEGGPTAEFTVPGQFPSSGNGEYKFYTVYPASAASEDFSTAPLTTLSIPSEQTPSAESFDPAADLLVGYSVRTYTSKPTEAIPLMWDRLVAHGEITLKNLTGIEGFSATETIESVTLTAQNGAALTGSFLYDLSDGTTAMNERLVAEDASDAVTVRGDHLSWNGGNLTFWMAIRPVEITALTVTIVTDKATYTKSYANISRTFLRNTHNKLGINMADASRTEMKEYYVKVTENLTDWSGRYVLGFDSGTVQKMLTGISTTSTKYGIATDVTITDDKIAYETGHPYEITIAKSGSYYTMSFGGKYLSWYSGNSLILANSPSDNLDGGEWTISYSGGTLTISNANTSQRLLQYNSSSPRFACYTGTLEAPSLYKLTGSSGGSTDPDPAATATVTTGEASSLTQTSATLNGSFSGATGTISEVGFYLGTTNNPTTKVVATGTTSPFTYSLSGLSANTTYYFQAYVKEYNAATASVEERTGDVVSFTTESAGQTTQYYEKVTSALSDWSGEYLIVYEAGSLAFNGALTSNLHKENGISVTISGGKVEKTSATAAAQFTVTKSGDGYTIRSASGYYIGNTINSNYLDNNASTEFINSISCHSAGYVDVISSGGAYLRYIPSSSSLSTTKPRFCYVASGSVSETSVIQLYKLGGSSGGGDTPATATATVTTSAATGISATGATLNGSYSGATGTVSSRGFYWGTSSNPATKVTVSSTSTSFSYALTGLTDGRTYYFRAFVVEFNASTNSTEERLGSVVSFVAQQGSVNTPPGYLGCYEMPELSLSGVTSNGNETYGTTKWWEYDTSSSTQKVITHTYAYNGTQYRNYTALVDKNKRCPLWTAYVMHSGAYPNNDAGRSGDWTYDPGIPQSWQSSGSTSDYNNGAGYARGHHCASEDRQTCTVANQQTFYYTNQSPQRQNSFNSGVWSSLEGAVQNAAPSGRDTLYVVVGTLFEDGNSGSSNDGGTVARPSHFYKLLMKCSFNASGTMTAALGTAFIYSNEAHSGSYNDSQYVTTIDAIETRSGFNFFVNVPSALQEAAESGTNKLTL